MDNLTIDDQVIIKLEKILGLEFKEKDKLIQALIHRSYLNENKNLNISSNERYEFLGDAVLELWISDRLFRQFPDMKEGDLTNLRALIVRTENLASIASDLDIGDFILLSRGEETHGGRQNLSILADTTESIIGAVYLDQGYGQVAELLERIFNDSIKELSSQRIYKDPKSVFQELAQARRGITPHYETIEESGPDHNKTFKIAVYLEDELIATGEGHSKQKAEEDASIKATKKLRVTV
ncbi:MAG TPA: ribonuclease III [Patescibacteria group bacterium]